MSFSTMSEVQAIRALQDVAITWLRPRREPSQSEMSELISAVEKQFPNTGSFKLEFWLAMAIRSYKTWFLRGKERKPYLLKAVEHFERAYALSQGVIPEEVPPTDKRNVNARLHPRDRMTIACEVGSLLVDEALIRDLERGMSYLGSVFNNTTQYYPRLCSYAEAFYKMRDYAKAAGVALELHHRAEQDAYWKECVPPAPMATAAKAYRAKAKEHKKNGEIGEAICLFQKLVDTNLATKNDQKILEKLQNLDKQEKRSP